ncbi:hypothetical protein [Chelatococcus asaccharovorans]|uniref:Uncharacterized protein n=1 Tax=Chelatococcus asaccharovorans TaxID=28210 RepID=A0A2V3TZ56_9HYPH|nr:hypothetical protein [Chelatococcus asaccharovorans]PXW54676.1 hypothetical protein C7450_111208 [Chelatococcus asaccharovorans]CAH1650077.1 conserved hypothetical protein [Chelatococcus asaccharovorans]CAH1686816.1 conserved hypothetical protein [Chelatococcus asaccharovorans]
MVSTEWSEPEDLIIEEIRKLVVAGIQARSFVSVVGGVSLIRTEYPDAPLTNAEIADLIVKCSLAAGVPLELGHVPDNLNMR